MRFLKGGAGRFEVKSGDGAIRDATPADARSHEADEFKYRARKARESAGPEGKKGEVYRIQVVF